MSTPRCDWSDLPTDDCNHCHPEPRPAKPLSPSAARERLRAEAAAALVPAMRVVYPVANQDPTEHLPGLRHLPTDTAQWTVHDYVTALTSPTRHHEPYTPDGAQTEAKHRTDSPSLLQQLWSAAETSRGYDSGSRAGFGSRPSASLEALDVALDIENGVHVLLAELGVEHSHRDYPDTTQAVIYLGSLIDDTKEHEARAKIVRGWWAAARVVTGWDLPAWKPANTCPLCGARGELRVKYPEAFCVGCRSVWDESSIGVLVEHIRWENHEDETDDGERMGA